MDSKAPGAGPSAHDSEAAGRMQPVRVLCQCGRAVSVEGPAFGCDCGAELGHADGDIAVFPPPTPYWGEIDKPAMEAFLAACESKGWRTAVEELSPGMRDNIMRPERAAFQDILPIPNGSLVLDVGAGLGNLSTALAANHRVVALEGVAERARFIGIRKRQDGLGGLLAINANLNSIRFDRNQFDAIVINGVLEWAGLFDLTAPPHVVQERFLRNLCNALKPTGFMYVAIENRISWNAIRGANDHSGLPYTSLMPRFLANYVCRRGTGFRSGSNVGYRTYTYSYYGYQRLFRRAGLDIHYAWAAPLGYNLPIHLVPFNSAAIKVYVSWKWLRPPITWRAALSNKLRGALATPFAWRLLSADFAFALRPRR